MRWSGKGEQAWSDVTWHSLDILKKNSPHQKKLIIISDGDETSKHLSLKTASALAKQAGIKVYTIGIGTTGLAPFGDQYYTNTFSDTDLRSIATGTGGKYFYLDNGLKDHTSLEDVLRMILND